MQRNIEIALRSNGFEEEPEVDKTA